MSIVGDDEILEFLGIQKGYFEITSINDILVLTSDEGGPCNIDITDGNYEGDGLATALQTSMNADATLTGGVITFAVSYSSTTRKFTIDAGTGHTIAYTHSGSDAGLTLGFTANKSAAQTITSDNEAGDPTAIIIGDTGIRNNVESWIKKVKCGRDFESASYSEFYNGTDGNKLFLKQYPVTAVTRVSIGRIDIAKICNTNSGTRASVSVSTSGLLLELDGTVDETITFAIYTTITAVLNAINSLSNGWSASLINSAYGNFKSTELLTRFGANAINSNWVYLEVPEEPEDEFEVYPDGGYIHSPYGFSKGSRNIYIQYTAGYSSTTMPDNLKLAVKILVQYIYQKRDEKSFGLNSYSIAGISTAFADDIPFEADNILKSYKRHNI